MADKRISQLVERTDIANNDVVPIVASGATTTNKATISSIQTFMQENLDVGVTSVGITLGSSGNDVSVTGSPITTSGNITINIPTASATARGLVSTGTQTFAGAKTFSSDIIVNGVNIGKGGTSVPSNTSLGSSALQDNTTGANNTAVGFSSLIFTTTGTSNTAIGHQVLSNCDGSANTGIGVSSLFNLTTGANNAGFGNGAGNQISSGANNTTSNNSIFIGTDTRPAANNQINQIVIGHQAVGQGSNTVTIGNSSITSNKLFGRVIHADAVNADESATLGQINTSLGGYVTLNTAQTITAQKTFTTSGSSDTMIISHGSGSGIALDVIKAGNGQAIRVQKTSGTGDAVTITGDASITGAFSVTNSTSTFAVMNSTNANGGVLTFRRNGTNVGHIGNSAQLGGGVLDAIEVRSGVGSSVILRSDGGQVTLATGGLVTLTGALNGTSATFASSGSTNLVVERTGSNGSFMQLKDASGNSVFLGARNGDFEVQTPSGSFSNKLVIANSGAATFSSSVRANASSTIYGATQDSIQTILTLGGQNASAQAKELYFRLSAGGTPSWTLQTASVGTDAGINILPNGTNGLSIAYTGAATFSSSVTAGDIFSTDGTRINFFGVGTGANVGYVGMTTNHSLAFLTNNTERMRITSGGDVLVGATSIPGAGSSTIGVSLIPSGAITAQRNAATVGFFGRSNDGELFAFYRGTTQVGNISVTSSATSYNTSSDYRLKENVNPVENALSKLNELKPCNFNFITEPEKEVIGFLAHEVQEVMPQAVTGEKDAVEIKQVEVSPAELDEEGNVITEAVIEEKEVPVYQGIDHSKLVPLLVAAIQELKTQIDSLKNQIK